MPDFQPRFRLIHEPDDAVADAYWMTHAGGGTNTLVHRMRTLRGDIAARVWSPWMPAREELSDVEFDGDLDEMARLLAGQILADRTKRRLQSPFVLIGHSFGGVLAYRIARQLASDGMAPRRLVVLSFPAPDQATHQQQLHTLSDQALIREVDSLFGGVPDNIRDDESVQPLFVPGLRCDLGLLERYQHASSDPISVPIVAICGTDDRAVDMSHMQRWKALTSEAFRLRSMPGDHFFPLSRMPEILRVALWDVLPG